MSPPSHKRTTSKLWEDNKLFDATLVVKLADPDADDYTHSNSHKLQDLAQDILSLKYDSKAVLAFPKEHPVHRAVLYCTSDYFKTLLDGWTSHTGQPRFVIEIDHPDQERLVELMLYHMYHGCLPDDATSLQLLQLLVMADKYCVPTCVEDCSQMLRAAHFEERLVLTMWELPESIRHSDCMAGVLDHCRSWTRQRLQDLEMAWCDPDLVELFLSMPIDEVIHLLEWSALQTMSENIVLLAVGTWLMRNCLDSTTLIAAAARLIRYVRLPLLSQTYSTLMHSTAGAPWLQLPAVREHFAACHQYAALQRHTPCAIQLQHQLKLGPGMADSRQRSRRVLPCPRFVIPLPCPAEPQAPFPPVQPECGHVYLNGFVFSIKMLVYGTYLNVLLHWGLEDAVCRADSVEHSEDGPAVLEDKDLRRSASNPPCLSEIPPHGMLLHSVMWSFCIEDGPESGLVQSFGLSSQHVVPICNIAQLGKGKNELQIKFRIHDCE